MSEQLNTKWPENLLPKLEQEEKMLPEGEHEKLLEAGNEQKISEQLEKARSEAAAEASKAEHSEAVKTIESSIDTEDNLPDSGAAISKDLKDIVKRRELLSIQRRETKRERALSKLVHQPSVKAVSEVSASTVSRPSGMLGGGLVALIGTGGYYYLSRHIGLKYNYSMFVVLFAGGFVLGVTLEMVLRLIVLSKRRNI